MGRKRMASSFCNLRRSSPPPPQSSIFNLRLCSPLRPFPRSRRSPPSSFSIPGEDCLAGVMALSQVFPLLFHSFNLSIFQSSNPPIFQSSTSSSFTMDNQQTPKAKNVYIPPHRRNHPEASSSSPPPPSFTSSNSSASSSNSSASSSSSSNHKTTEVQPEDKYFRLFEVDEVKLYFGNPRGVVTRNLIDFPRYEHGHVGKIFHINRNEDQVTLCSDEDQKRDVGDVLYYTGILFYDEKTKSVLLRKTSTKPSIDLVYRMENKSKRLEEDIKNSRYDLMSNSELRTFRDLDGTADSLSSIYQFPFRKLKEIERSKVVVEGELLELVKECAREELDKRAQLNDPKFVDPHNWSITKKLYLVPGYKSEKAKDYVSSPLKNAVADTKSLLNLSSISSKDETSVIENAASLDDILIRLKKKYHNSFQGPDSFDSDLDNGRGNFVGKLRAFMVPVDMSKHKIITATFKDSTFEWVPFKELETKMTSSMFQQFVAL